MRSRLTTLDRLSPDTAVIYPIMFSSRLELLMSLPTGLTRVSVPVTADRLTQEIREFRRLVEKRTTREYLPHAQQLYDWLVRPLEPDLSQPADHDVGVCAGQRHFGRFRWRRSTTAHHS